MSDLLISEKFKIFDDILSPTQENEIEKLFLSQQFSWYYSENTSLIDNDFKYKEYLKENKIKEYFQFTHVFFNSDIKNLTSHRNSNHCDFVLNILDIFKLKTDLNFLKILRVKANLQTFNKNSSVDNFTAPHHDFYNLDHYVLLYYVNNSDGDTFLFDDDLNIINRISPKKGRFLFFNGNILHASSNPIQNEKRIVLNFNLLKTYE